MLEKYFTPQLYLPVLYICIAVLVNGIIKRIINRLTASKMPKDSKSYNYKKIETFRILLKNMIKYIIIILTFLAILTVYGIDVTSVLAGLGIVGIVVGLALQDLAKDLVAGFSLILENQYAIGDTISIGTFKGEVVFLGLRTTRIKSEDGQIKIIANRNITEVINYSMSPSLATVDIIINNDYDINKVEKALGNLVDELNENLTNLKGRAELVGITDLTLTSATYKIIVPTKAMQHIEVERQIRKRVRNIIIDKKDKLLQTQQGVHNGK